MAALTRKPSEDSAAAGLDRCGVGIDNEQGHGASCEFAGFVAQANGV
jgi:hypothetical protein